MVNFMLLLTDWSCLQHQLPNECIGAPFIEVTLSLTNEWSFMQDDQSTYQIYGGLLVSVVLRSSRHCDLPKYGGWAVKDIGLVRFLFKAAQF